MDEELQITRAEKADQNSAAAPKAIGVTVIIPSFNHAAFVEQAIRSVWAQDYGNLELIVVDDCSTDATAEIVERMLSDAPIPMRLIRKTQNCGISNSLNRGIEMATGDWLAFLSSDDFFSSGRISRQIEVATQVGEQYGCIHGDALQVDEFGKALGRINRAGPISPARGDVFDQLIQGTGRIITTTAMVRRNLAIDIGGFDEKFVAEDFDFYLRVSRRSLFLYLNEVLTNVRVSPKSLGRQPWRWGEDIISSIQKHTDVPGFDWSRILARRRTQIAASLFEHGSAGQIAKGLKQAFRASKEAGDIPYLFSQLSKSAFRAVGYRAKKNLVRWVKRG